MPDGSDATGRARRRDVELRLGREARAVVAVVGSLDADEAARRDVDRRVLARRRVVARFAVEVARFAVEVARFAVDAARLAVDAARRRVETAARRVDVAARRVDVAARRLVPVARRRVDDVEPFIAWRACLVRPSIRLRTLLTSARVLAFLTCD